MTDTAFRYITTSNYIGDWLHLIESRLEIAWMSRRFSGKVTGRLTNIYRETSALLGAGLRFTVLNDEGVTTNISQAEVVKYVLTNYIPNGPRAGTVAIPRALLERPDVREFLLNAPSLEYEMIIVPK